MDRPDWWRAQLALSDRVGAEGVAGPPAADRARGGSEWALRVLYPCREACSQIHTFCEEHNLSVTIDAIRTVDADRSIRYGLTETQQRALVQAYEQGYFAVPRDVNLDTVAETLDISHQPILGRL